MNHASLTSYDSQIAAAIADEVARQEAHIELIASENYASPQVMEAQGTLRPQPVDADPPRRTGRGIDQHRAVHLHDRHRADRGIKRCLTRRHTCIDMQTHLAPPCAPQAGNVAGGHGAKQARILIEAWFISRDLREFYMSAFKP